MYGRKYINGSVEWLGVLCFGRDDELPWTENILCPNLRWGYGCNVENWAWGSQPGSHYVGVDVLWRGAIFARAAYLDGSPKNARATA